MSGSQCASHERNKGRRGLARNVKNPVAHFINQSAPNVFRACTEGVVTKAPLMM